MLILNKTAKGKLINNKVLMRKISASADISLQYLHEDKAVQDGSKPKKYILMEV